MGIILKRVNKYQGLKDIDVLVDEKGLNSQYFNITQIPHHFHKVNHLPL